MRLAFSTLACPDWPFDRVLAACADYGYDGVELRMLGGALVSPAIDATHRAEVRAACERAGVAVCCLDTSFEIASPDGRIDDALACIELAADVGAPMIRLFGGAPEQEEPGATARRVAERVAALADRGRELGVTVALETHDSFASGRTTAAVLEDVPADVGIIWDTLNTFVTGEPPAETLASVADRLVHVHLKDGGVPPDPERNVLFGRGVVPLGDIIGMLAASGYDGWLAVEWEKHWQPSIPDADVALPSYANGVRAILAGARAPESGSTDG
jgi:sugar phosphate isomerase/epimerase